MFILFSFFSQCNVSLKRTDNLSVLFIPKYSGSCSVNSHGVKEKKIIHEHVKEDITVSHRVEIKFRNGKLSIIS